MSEDQEKRREQRLRYHWPVWYAENFNGALSQGQMIDVSSGGASFTCHADKNCPCPGRQITTRFSVPCYGTEGSFDMANFTRDGYVCRIDQVSDFIHRIAIQFVEPLPFKPGEQDNSSEQAQQRLGMVVV